MQSWPRKIGARCKSALSWPSLFPLPLSVSFCLSFWLSTSSSPPFDKCPLPRSFNGTSRLLSTAIAIAFVLSHRQDLSLICCAIPQSARQGPHAPHWLHLPSTGHPRRYFKHTNSAQSSSWSGKGISREKICTRWWLMSLWWLLIF